MNPTDTNAGGWEASQLRAYLNSDGMSLLPQDLADRIIAVDKLTNNVGKTEDVSSVSVTSDKLWLPSPVELCDTIGLCGPDYGCFGDVLNAEGSGYKLYRDTNVVWNGSDSVIVKNLNGAARDWWERSPDPSSSHQFIRATEYGDPILGDPASDSIGLVFGFCI